MAQRKRPNFFGVWLSDTGKQTITDHATAANITKSEVVRRMLAYAAKHMPKGWKP